MVKLGAIQIFVSDWQKAKQWYADVLGMEPAGDYPETQAAWMKFDGVDFYLETPNPGWGSGWDAVSVGGRRPIIFETEDIAATVKAMKWKGVRFVEEIAKRPWGEEVAVFADSDGNEFNLVQSAG